MPPNFLAIKQRIQSSHIPPCRRHMVIATNLSSWFDLLHCSTPQTRAECCLEFAVGSGYGMFPGLSRSATPPPIVPVRRAMQGSPPISQHQKVKQRLHGRPTGARTISWARGHKQVSKSSTHARPGMHMQQCSAVPQDHWCVRGPEVEQPPGGGGAGCPPISWP